METYRNLISKFNRELSITGKCGNDQDSDWDRVKSLMCIKVGWLLFLRRGVKAWKFLQTCKKFLKFLNICRNFQSFHTFAGTSKVPVFVVYLFTIGFSWSFCVNVETFKVSADVQKLLKVLAHLQKLSRFRCSRIKNLEGLPAACGTWPGSVWKPTWDPTEHSHTFKVLVPGTSVLY
jgi:hypothetical protein